MQVAINKLVYTYQKKYDKYKKQKQRLKQFITNELNNKHNVYFSTFTFKNEFVNIEFDIKIRRRFTNYLNRNGLKCKLYADYGFNTDRFHLHGFISTDRNNLYNEFNKFGWTKHIQLHEVEDLQKEINYCIVYSTKNNSSDFKPISVNPKIRK